jgi:hypothetical protein
LRFQILELEGPKGRIFHASSGFGDAGGSHGASMADSEELSHRGVYD